MNDEEKAQRMHEELLVFLSKFRDENHNYEIEIITWTLADVLLNHFIQMDVKKEMIMPLLSDHYDIKIADMKELGIFSEKEDLISKIFNEVK